MHRRKFISAATAALAIATSQASVSTVPAVSETEYIELGVQFDPTNDLLSDVFVRMPAALAYIWDNANSIMHCVIKGSYTNFAEDGGQPLWKFEPDAGHVKSLRFEPFCGLLPSTDPCCINVKVDRIDAIDITDTDIARESRKNWLNRAQA